MTCSGGQLVADGQWLLVRTETRTVPNSGIGGYAGSIWGCSLAALPLSLGSLSLGEGSVPVYAES